MYQNLLFDDDNLQKLLAKLIEHPDLEKIEKQQELLWLPFVPAQITRWFSGFKVGAAGLLLVLSAFFGGWRMSFLVWPAAALAFFGPLLGVPAVGPLSPALVSIAGAVVLAVLAFIFLRE
jgi:hypothetical protein